MASATTQDADAPPIGTDGAEGLTKEDSDEPASCAVPLQIRGAWWYVRHPWARLSTALGIFVLDFLYYAEDPLVHSHVQIEIPVGGQALTMLISQWPSSGGLCVLKVFWAVLCVVLGCVLGRQLVHHWLLRDKLRINMFEDCNGSWTVMLIVSVLVLWIGSYPYNAMIGSEEPEISSNLHMRGFEFGILAQMCTWIGDLWTLVMVLDSMLQDSTLYPAWCQGTVKDLWAKIRVWGCWVLAIAPTVVCFTLLILNDIDEGEDSEWDRAAPGSSEWQRCLLVSTVVLTDLSILIQDWEFPTFDSSVSEEIKLPGFNVSEIDFRLLGWLKDTQCYKRCSGMFHVHISGKWVAYGPLMVILMLDLNAARNQFSYEPVNFGQYPNPDTGHIWTIIDASTIAAYYDGAQAQFPELVTYALRAGNPGVSSTINDVQMSARYEEEATAAKAAALLPGLLAVPTALVLFWWYNQSLEQRADRAKSRWAGLRTSAKVVPAATAKAPKTEPEPEPTAEPAAEAPAPGGRMSR